VVKAATSGTPNPCLPRNSRIFHNLRKLKIALDVDQDVIDGDFGWPEPVS
jgi:hypothetical protein